MEKRIYKISIHFSFFILCEVKKRRLKKEDEDGNVFNSPLLSLCLILLFFCHFIFLSRTPFFLYSIFFFLFLSLHPLSPFLSLSLNFFFLFFWVEIPGGLSQMCCTLYARIFFILFHKLRSAFLEDLPLLLFSLLVAQFGTSSEPLISRFIVSVWFLLSRRFKVYFFGNLFCRGGHFQDLYLIAN
uniref:Uncharacterized protein n=1 Tax=Cucumis sativus TaxID=3659 RepID=A0A0A0KCH0_CUCSA